MIFIALLYTTAPADAGGVLEGVAWVPIDDENTMAFAVTYNPARKLSKKALNEILADKELQELGNALQPDEALKEELGLDGVVVELNAGGLIPEERVLRSLRIMTEKVMPTFK